MNRYAKAAAGAAAKTNAALAGEIAALGIPASTASKLIVEEGDAERLRQLLAIVSRSTSENEKIAALQANMDQLGGVLVRVVALVAAV